MAIYDYQGNVIESGGGTAQAINYDATVKGIAHRGYSETAPENTLPAYKLAKQNGFNYVECDVSFTSDGIPMLLHDATIDRTSNGSGTLSQMTYAQVRQYDFGSWKNSSYAGTVIPTLEEFITLCRNIGLHPYIELKENGSYTEAQVQGIVDIVNSCGMQGNVSYISFSATYIGYVHAYDAGARIGRVTTNVTSGEITHLLTLKGSNEIFVDASNLGDTYVNLCKTNGIPMEAWTVDSTSTILSMNPYVTGVTSNSLIAGKVLYEANIE